MHMPLYARPAANAAGGTRVEPSRHLTAQGAGFKYTDSAHTDLAEKFKAMRAEQERRAAIAKNEAVRAAKFAKDHAAQHRLQLEDSATMPAVPRFLRVVG